MDTSKFSDQLNDLLKRNYDAAKGYRKAAEHVDSPELASFMEGYAQQRDGFVRELRTLVSGLGGTPQEEKDIPGSLHHAWMDLKAAFSSNDDEAMLEECIRGEKAAIKEYDEVLGDTNLPANVSAILRDQRMKIEEALHKVEELEEEYD